ncbi:MAG: glycosyltransferase family 25 protein [Planctomycetota bacterium]|nr:glycosyltransferase family 25 protein [Planctomycetota bacterium]MDA1212134.1 glycosyltransferase family 25 protein [Planctomycetota bacterium]
MSEPGKRTSLSCYVLTLDSPGGARYESARRQLECYPLATTFVEGIRLTRDDRPFEYSRWLNLLMMKRAMTPGEISVYLGHRKIWHQILNDGHDLALVLEDDFFIHDAEAFVQAIDDAMQIQPRWDIVKFFDFRPKRVVQSFPVNQTTFVMHKYAASGCVAYLMRAAAAKRLLERRHIYRPVDEDWSHPWESDLRILSVEPNPVAEIASNLGGSLLEAERRKMKSFQRNWLRSLYGNVLTVKKNAQAMIWRRKMANV